MTAGRHIKRLMLGTLVLVVIGCGGWRTLRYVTAKPRVAWKDEALERFWTMALTKEVVLREVEELKDRRGEAESVWVHENVLRMTNGEYVVYEYRHGRNDFFPPHLFLGRSSDGRWLYSSYHFCNGMAIVSMDDAPASVTEFMARYSAREFDGKSDECLKETR